MGLLRLRWKLAVLLPTADAFISPLMRVSGVESTPNPCSFKFDLEENIQGTRGTTYSSRTSRGAPEPIRRLLDLPGVESVYALGNWVCVNKAPSAKWDPIVFSAIEALGGASEAFDPSALLIAPARDAGSGWSRSIMDGIAVRVQMSNGIPIQVEACQPGDTPLRRKLPQRFTDAMSSFVNQCGDEMAFFKGREWISRGVRYPEGDPATVDAAEDVLNAAIDEIELTFHESRLRGVVDRAVASAKKSGESTSDGSATHAPRRDQDGPMNGVHAVQQAAAQLRSSVRGDVISAVDLLCDLAGGVDKPDNIINSDSRAEQEALQALIGFVGSGDGPAPARRAAVAFVGGTGAAAGSAGLEAVASVFRGDKIAGVRRTAGDALSDLGNPDAVPVALSGLADRSKLVRWRAARVLGELSTRDQDAIVVDETRTEEVEFEVAFEMADAARKIRTRCEQTKIDGGVDGSLGKVSTGPVWKQIQERGR